MSELKKYDLFVICRPQALKDSDDQFLSLVKSLLKRNGGRVVREKLIGKRRLSQPIGKENEGFDSQFIIEIPSENIQTLSSVLSVREEVLRVRFRAFVDNLDKHVLK